MATAVLRRDPVGDEWLDIEGASHYTKLSRHTVYDAVRADEKAELHAENRHRR